MSLDFFSLDCQDDVEGISAVEQAGGVDSAGLEGKDLKEGLLNQQQST